MLAFALILAALPPPERVIPLEGETHHVQGIVIDQTSVWVTSVDRAAREAVLFRFDLKDGRRQARKVLGGEPYYHPGGMDTDGESLWIPLAEYRPASRSIIERRSTNTLDVLSSFEVPDHIGCVALFNGRLYGANWDARDIYEWSLDGKLVRKRPNPTGFGFQDLKGRGGLLVGAGMSPRETKNHSVVWLDPETLAVRRQILAGETDRRVAFVNEGLDIRDGYLYLLPEDGPSRLYMWQLASLPER